MPIAAARQTADRIICYHDGQSNLRSLPRVPPGPQAVYFRLRAFILSHNFELKARLPDLPEAARIAEGLDCRDRFELDQLDTYFRVLSGRLKLRECPQIGDELIFYHRPDQASAKSCFYWRQPTIHAAAVRRALIATCQCETTVKKSRRVYLIDNIRIHLDEVAQLGSFLEFEAVIETAAHQSAAAEQLGRLSETFGIQEKHHVAGSYRELMLGMS